MARRVRRGIAAVFVFLALLFALVVGLSATVVSAVSEWLGSAVERVPGVDDAVGDTAVMIVSLPADRPGAAPS